MIVIRIVRKYFEQMAATDPFPLGHGGVALSVCDRHDYERGIEQQLQRGRLFEDRAKIHSVSVGVAQRHGKSES